MKVKMLISCLILVLIISRGKQSNISQVNDISELVRGFENGFPIFTANEILLGETITLVERMEHYYVPGVSIAVINNHEIEWAKGYGVLDAEGEPVPGAVVLVASPMGDVFTVGRTPVQQTLEQPSAHVDVTRCHQVAQGAQAEI